MKCYSSFDSQAIHTGSMSLSNKEDIVQKNKKKRKEEKEREKKRKEIKEKKKGKKRKEGEEVWEWAECVAWG